MIISSITIGQNKPLAFKDENDIEYLYIEFHDLEFVYWGSSKLTMNFQVPRGMKKDICSVLDFIFTKKIPCTNKITVSIPNKILLDGWFITGGTYKVNKTDDFCIWSKAEYRRYLKSDNKPINADQQPDTVSGKAARQ